MYGSFSGDRQTPNLAAEVDTSCNETEAGSPEDDSDEDLLSASLTNIVNVSTTLFNHIDICLYRKCSYLVAPDGIPAE